MGRARFETLSARATLAAANLVVVLGLMSGCAPGDFEDGGAADLTLSPADGAPLQIIHSPGLSVVRVTPPVDGEVELSFSYNDPLIDVTLLANANLVSEGEVVALPADPTALFLTVLLDDVEYGSGEGSSGSVELQVLSVDDETGAAEVSAVIAATLVSADGEELVVDGFVEGSVAGDDAGG